MEEKVLKKRFYIFHMKYQTNKKKLLHLSFEVLKKVKEKEKEVIFSKNVVCWSQPELFSYDVISSLVIIIHVVFIYKREYFRKKLHVKWLNGFWTCICSLKSLAFRHALFVLLSAWTASKSFILTCL